MAFQNLGFFKEYKDIGLTSYRNLRFSRPVKILGYFIRTMFLTPKNPCPTCACQNLGTFKEYKDIGLTSYRNLRLCTYQNLGVSCFLTPKPTAYLCLSKSWDLKSTEILGLHRIEIFRFSTCQNLVVFHKNHVFHAKYPWPTFSCQNLGIFEKCKDSGPTLY